MHDRVDSTCNTYTRSLIGTRVGQLQLVSWTVLPHPACPAAHLGQFSSGDNRRSVKNQHSTTKIDY